ncbi:MAG: hypothetical protein JWO06_725 [Bacteroidota bacterium]|nr:hypothetical protein [Bacteroidota bacterium]
MCNMKRILTLLFFCFSVVFLSAQFPHWDWARCAKSSISNTIGFEEGTAVSTDPSNGNVIVGGFFYQDTFAFGNITLGNDYQGLFITKYDSSGNVLWAKEAIGDIESANSGLWAIATDLKGNVFITGGFSGPTLQLDSVLLNNPNGFIPNDNVFFLAKYDASGNLLWAISSSAESGGKGVTCDKWGNVYVTGYFAGTFTLGSTTLIDTLWQSDVFIAKFDSLGNAVWAKQAKGAPLSSTNSGIGISSSLTTAQTDLYVTGFFVNTITFDTITLNPSSDSVYNFDFFIAKYDSSGNLLWAKAGLGNLLIYTQLPSPYSYGLPVAEDRFGNAYVAGGFTNKTIVFGRDTLWNSDISGIGINIFVVKFDALGNVTWSKSVKGNCGDRACGITADPWGNFYLAASFYDSISFGSFSLGISD